MNQDIIKIRIPNTKFWVLGEQRSDSKWNIFLIDPNINYKKLIKGGMTTKAFAIFSNVVLETPFPYQGEIKETPLNTVPQINLQQHKELENLVKRQEQELSKYKKMFSDLAPLLDKLNKNPKIKQAIIDDRISFN